MIAWDPPPGHLAYDWYLGGSREQPSRVDVRFTDLGDSRTRVAVTHRGPELLGALWSRNRAIYDRLKRLLAERLLEVDAMKELLAKKA